jgi:hypothetical protein
MGPTQELRRSRRLDIGKLVAGKLVPSGAPIKIRDIGFGGFAMETPFAVRLGATLDFRFTSKDGSSFILKARVAHCRKVPVSLGPVFYVSGLEFADKQTPAGREAVDVLIEKVNWILSFYQEKQKGKPRRTSAAGQR